MPKIVDIEGVGNVQVPDETTDAEILQLAGLLSKGRIASAAATVAREPGRMTGEAISGLARFGQLFGETLERNPMALGPGGMIPGTALQSDEEIRATSALPEKSSKQLNEELYSNPIHKFGQEVREKSEKAFEPNPLHEGRFETAVASGIGSVLGLLPSVLTGPAAPVTAGALYGLSQGEDMAQEAEQAIDARVDALARAGKVTEAADLERKKFAIQTGALLAGTAVGSVTEGVIGVAGRLGSIATGKSLLGKEIAKRIGERPIVEGAVEGLVREFPQEGLEQLAQNLAAGSLYDPDRKALEGLGTAAGAGGVVGALFGGGAGALRRKHGDVEPTPEQRETMPRTASELEKLAEQLAKKDLDKTASDEDAITPPLTVPSGTKTKSPTPETPAAVQKQADLTADPESTKSVTLVTPGETMPVVPEGLATDPIEAALDKAIAATDPKGKVFDFVTGVSYAVANTALKIAKAIYTNTRDLVSAVNAALQHMRDESPNGFDESAARAKVQDMLLTGQDVIPPGAAAGDRTRMSQGRFKGPIQADSDAQWHRLATEWISQFGNDIQTAFEKATSPIEGIDPALKQYVLSELLVRTEDLVNSRNPVEMMNGLRLQEQIAGYMKDSGAQEFGKVGVARALAFKRIDWMMPVLALRGLVKSAQERLPFPEFTSDAVRKWLQAAGRRAVNEMRKSMKSADNVVSRELRREVRDMATNWRSMIEASEAVQGDFRRALYAAVFNHPELRGISPEGATEVVNLLADEWERQRLRIFRQEFQKEVKLPGVRQSVIDKLQEAIPDIVRQANIGLLDNEAFRNAVAPKFGVSKFDGETAEIVKRMAQEAQALPAGVVRNRVLSQIVDAIRTADGIRGVELFRDYWYAAMLSGIRTLVDNGISILNGTLTAALAVARHPKSAKLVTTAYVRNLAEAARDFVPILEGERWRLHNIDTDRPASALESLLRSKNILAKMLGSAAFASRLINALDHLNSLSTRGAMIAWGLHRMDPERAKAILSVSKEEISAAREQAIQEGTPKNLLPNRIREILEERVPSEIVIAATDIGRQASYQNTPTGILGHFYQFITKLDDFPFIGRFTRIISGTAFARYAINYTNDLLNYVAPVGLARWYLSAPGVGKIETTPENRELILMKSMFGTVLAAAAAAVFLGDDDDDDEKKRAIDLTGSFRSLPTSKKNQLLSEGRHPYSIRVGDTYISYRQLPIAGILGTIGEMRDRQLFDRENWKQDGVAAQLANGAIAGMFIVRDSSSLVGLTDLIGFANVYKVDTEQIISKSIPRFVARLAGSLIPNIAKEVDAWTDPSIYRPNSGWEYFLSNVPWARRTLEGGPARNIFGEPVKVEKMPWSRWVRVRDTSQDWATVGALASRGVFLPMPGEFKITNDDGTRRNATPAEVNRYQKEVGEKYRAYIQDEGAALLEMSPDEAREQIEDDTQAIRQEIRDQF